MPRATTAYISITEALKARDIAQAGGQPNPAFICTECGRPVRPHAASGYGDAHFEHLERNPECSQSSK